MPIEQRDSIEYVNGATFFSGFVSFLVVMTIVLFVGYLIRRYKEEDHSDQEANFDEQEYFNKIEDFRNDFR